MIEGATVTLPLKEFDELREQSREFRKIAPQIAACFEYELKEYSTPEKCKTCQKENPVCTKCKVFKESPPWEEFLTVDVERLINLTKQYAFYGEELYSTVEEMTVVIKDSKKSGGKSK
ncbi:MAG: hypothetical protein NC401_06565 [Ruminococcus sp.]|nr:hypothetical protein [Ruminococcus sp.]